jgi:hypothetical protein
LKTIFKQRRTLEIDQVRNKDFKTHTFNVVYSGQGQTLIADHIPGIQVQKVLKDKSKPVNTKSVVSEPKLHIF